MKTAIRHNPTDSNQKHCLVILDDRDVYSVCYTDGAERVILTTVVLVRAPRVQRRILRTEDPKTWAAIRQTVLDGGNS